MTPDRPTACVFAPSPLLTVTIEEARDGGDEVHLHVGGQAYWIANLMSELGVQVSLCGSFGGETGRVLLQLLEEHELIVRDTRAGGGNGAYVHDRRSGERQRVAAVEPASLSRHEVDDLYGVTTVEALTADVTVLGGPSGDDVLPPDVYSRLAADLRANGKTVVADLAGDRMTAVLGGGVDLLKVSDEELAANDLAKPDADDRELVPVMQQLAETGSGATAVVVSRAERRPTLALDLSSGESVLLRAHGPEFNAVEHKGAGDSLTAGLATALARGLGIDAGLRLGVAAGALNVTRRGLGTGRRAEIERLSELVAIDTIDVNDMEETE